MLNPGPADPGYTLSLQTLSEEANWSGSVLFIIKNVNLHELSGSSNPIGWKLEVGVTS